MFTFVMVSGASYHANDYDSNDDDKDRGHYGHDEVEVRQDNLDSLFRGKIAVADLARGRYRT